jgi:hypothetical protein
MSLLIGVIALEGASLGDFIVKMSRRPKTDVPELPRGPAVSIAATVDDGASSGLPFAERELEKRKGPYREMAL